MWVSASLRSRERVRVISNVKLNSNSENWEHKICREERSEIQQQWTNKITSMTPLADSARRTWAWCPEPPCRAIAYSKRRWYVSNRECNRDRVSSEKKYWVDEKPISNPIIFYSVSFFITLFGSSLPLHRIYLMKPKPDLSTTPPTNDQSFTEQNMKKIHMPKKLEFWTSTPVGRKGVNRANSRINLRENSHG